VSQNARPHSRETRGRSAGQGHAVTRAPNVHGTRCPTGTARRPPERSGQAVIRVAVSDDQTLVRRGFVSPLEDLDDIAVVGEAIDGDEAVQLARRARPDGS